LGDEVKKIMLGISAKYDFNIIENEFDGDHIHMMIESEAKLSPLQFVRVLKQQSTFLI
jgi:putative transposase